MKYTKEQVEVWYQMCQKANGLSASLFKPKEIQVIQDFIETGKADLLDMVTEEKTIEPLPDLSNPPANCPICNGQTEWKPLAKGGYGIHCCFCSTTTKL